MQEGGASANTGFTVNMVVSIAAPIVVTNNTNANESFLFIKIFLVIVVYRDVGL